MAHPIEGADLKGKRRGVMKVPTHHIDKPCKGIKGQGPQPNRSGGRGVRKGIAGALLGVARTMGGHRNTPGISGNTGRPRPAPIRLSVPLNLKDIADRTHPLTPQPLRRGHLHRRGYLYPGTCRILPICKGKPSLHRYLLRGKGKLPQRDLGGIQIDLHPILIGGIPRRFDLNKINPRWRIG
jgi:hypothetical protein